MSCLKTFFFFFKTIGNTVFLALIWIVFFRKEYEKYKMFIPRRTTCFHMRRIALRDWKLLLITAACGDVVERVKSVYDQLSLFSPAGHPLHQAISHFILFWIFFLKRKTQENKLNRN